MPVSVQPVAQEDLEHTLSELGTVTARATVTVRAMIDGPLQEVNFREGQLVRAGMLLAQIDPRPYQAALANAKAQLQRDDAQMQNALVDLGRYRDLIRDHAIPSQQLDTQFALVRQLRGTVAVDRAQIETADVNLGYTRITAPVDGRIGLRQVDPGNIVHASDPIGMAVLTQVQPIDLVFPLPQDDLPEVLARMRAADKGGETALAVDAIAPDGHTVLARGRLMSIDSQVDTTTGTVKCKAAFPNRDLELFPNQFVTARLHLETIHHAVSVPASAVQSGTPGRYVYILHPGGTVALRTLKLGFADGDRIEVLSGLAAGDRVVVDGLDRLRDGTRVHVIDAPGR